MIASVWMASACAAFPVAAEDRPAIDPMLGLEAPEAQLEWEAPPQGHNTSSLSIGLLGAVAEMAWNQGVNLYGFDNNRVLAAAEYVARSGRSSTTNM